MTDKQMQEPVANLWKCLGRWSAYLVDNGAQAECAPPSWLVDAVKKATTPPAAQREWIGLTDEQKQHLNEVLNLQGRFPIIDAIEAKLKEKNT